MAHFLFVDESGHDLCESPYAVLAGISVEDRDLWNLIDAIRKLELNTFGIQYSDCKEEFKGKKFLKKKVFRLAAQEAEIDADSRRALSKDILENGQSPTRQKLTALCQAKLSFIREVLELCVRHNCATFASMVAKDSPQPGTGALRKDYAFLFERFYYYLDDLKYRASGVIVFDELEKAKSRILIDQMETYFLYTAKGRLRSRRIIPQPFFVHSDLTTMIQVADIIAYILAWGYRFSRKLVAPSRSELIPFAKQVRSLGYYTEKERAGNPRFRIWSIVSITDLRSKLERLKE